MKVTISGKHMEVGQSLSHHIEERLQQGINKYLDRVTDVNVVISKVAHMVETHITVNPGTQSNLLIKADARAADAYVSFDSAADKVEKQLRRYKRKLKHHHQPEKENSKFRNIQEYVLSQHEEEEELPENHNPLVIAENPTHIESITVSDAVMRMDLGHLPVLVFINSATDSINVLYRRADGNISWIDPSQAELAPTLRRSA